MTDKELLQQALDALEMSHELQDIGWVDFEVYKLTCDADILSKLNITIDAIKARLAQSDCVCGEPDSEGVHRKDKPCYVETEPTVDGWPLYSGLPQPEQEPTAYLCENAVGHKYFRWKKPSSEYKPIALYTAHASPKRIWQGLTDEEAKQVLFDLKVKTMGVIRIEDVVRAIEAKLKEKNHG